MSEINSNIKTEIPSEKSFGVVFSIIFLIICLYPLIHDEPYRLWSLILSILFLFLAFIVPRTLIALNKLWFKFGLLIGSILAPIFLVILYFVTVVPTGLIMRLLGKDLLNRKIDKAAKSYWIIRKDSIGSMKNQY